MVQNVNPTFVKTPNYGASKLSTGTTGSSVQSVYTGGANGSKINAFIATSFGTSASFDVIWGISSGSSIGSWIATLSVTQNAGSTDSVVAVNMFNVAGLPIDSDGNPYIFLPGPSYFLGAYTVASSSLWQTGATINLVVPSAGDF